MIAHVNEENFEEEILYSDTSVVVGFGVRWRAPHMMFDPKFKELSRKYKGKIKFLKCDMEKNKALADLLDVKSIPTLLIFYDGEIQHRAKGNYDVVAFEEKLKELLERC